VQFVWENAREEIIWGGKCPWKRPRGRNVRISIKNYKSILVAVMICVTLVNTHTDRQLLTAVLLAQPGELHD